MVSSLFHRQSQQHTLPDPSTLPRPALKTSLALSGLKAFSSSAAPSGSRATDGLDFVPYVAPSRGRESVGMGDISYEIAHPSKFSDWTDDGDERSLPPPSLGIGLLSKARAAIKLASASSSKEGGTPKSSIVASTLPAAPPASKPAIAPNPKSRAPSLAPLPAPTTESPIRRWLDLGISLSPPSSPTARRPTFVASPKKQAQAVTARMTAFQFLDGASPLASASGSPSRIRRQTDVGSSARSYAQMMAGPSQSGFRSRYPEFEVDATPHPGPTTKPEDTVKPARRTTAPAVPVRGASVQAGQAAMSMTKITNGTSSNADEVPSRSSSSISRRGEKTIFASFKRKERIRSDKPRARDIVAPADTGARVHYIVNSRQSMPAARLKEMFNTEPSRALPFTRDSLPAVETNEFGVMAVKGGTVDGANARDTPQSVRPDDSPLLGRQPWSPVVSRKSTSQCSARVDTDHLARAIGSSVMQRIRELTGDSAKTLVDDSPGPSRVGEVGLGLGSPMASPSLSSRMSCNVSPFSPGAVNWDQSPRSPIPEIGTSFLSLLPSPSPGDQLASFPVVPPQSYPRQFSPARDVSLVDPNARNSRFQILPHPYSAPAESEREVAGDQRLSRSPTPETDETDQSPQTKRVRSLTDMRDAFRRMQAFTGLDVSECDSRRTSTTVGGDMSDEEGIKTLDNSALGSVGEKKLVDYGDSPGVGEIVAQHIESVNLVLAGSSIVAKALVGQRTSCELIMLPGSRSTSTNVPTQPVAMVLSDSVKPVNLPTSAPCKSNDLANEEDRPSISRGHSGVSFHTALDDMPIQPMSRSVSKSSSLGALSTRNTADSLLEHVERREGSGWWSDSSRAADKAKNDEIIDKRLAALEVKAKSSPSPFQSLRSCETVIADDTPRRSGHRPRLSLVGNSTWSQGNDGSPVRRIESPRRIRGKRRVSRSRAQSIGSSPPSRHSFRAPINPPTSLISIDGSIAPSVPQLPAHALALKSPFARKVSPDIARRAELITHTKPLKPAGHTPTRRRLHQPVVASSSRQSDDEVGDRSQSSQSGSASGSDMSSLCRLEMQLGTTVRRRGKEIDTLITTLSQTRKENTTLRSEVDHRHAVLDDMLKERQ
jgi:hypothetical protein